jgi:hypothetical protein
MNGRWPGVVAAVALALADSGSAQTVRLALLASGGDYREQSAALSFDGAGVTGQLEIRKGRFRISARGARLEFNRAELAAADIEDFEQRELDLTGSVRLVSVVSIEAGALRRWVAPERAAQAVSVGRIGLRGDYPIAPGADGNLRVAALGGARFSGQGTAKLGIGLGFGLSYGARRRGVRMVIDYDFVRLDRETTGAAGLVSVPVQSSIARVGVALLF